MLHHTRFHLAVLAVAGLVSGSVGQLLAGEPGIVRIRDGAAAPISTHTTAQPAPVRAASHTHTGCSTGGCSSGECSACGENGCGSCGGNGCGREKSSCCCTKFCRHLKRHCCCLQGCNSPDHGWGRPIKRPIHDLPVLYQKYWPDAWAGQPGAGYARGHNHPAVYMPTDTTQLGYYYQRAPFWRPNPSMTPPAPWPAQWHQREYGSRPVGHDWRVPGYGEGFNGANGFSGNTCSGPGCGVGSPSYSTSPPLPQAPNVDESPAEPGELAPAPPPPTTDLNESAQNVIP